MNFLKWLLLSYTYIHIVNISYASDPIEVAPESNTKWKRVAASATEYSTIDIKKISIGRDLFFDTRLSGNHKLACASCHSPSLGWSDGLSTSKGRDGVSLARTSQTILNMHLYSSFMWDGRANSLQQQALLPLTSSNEMNLPADEIEMRVSAIPSYKERFERHYDGGVRLDNIIDAIVKFELTVVSTTSRFDQWIEGDEQALSAQEKQGFNLFIQPDKGNCAICHQAPSFTDDGFHNIGLVNLASKTPDVGRYAVKPVAVLKGAFRTPSLRDVELNAPYFHNGSAKNLEEVIDYYVKGGLHLNNLSAQMKPLSLNKEEQQALVAFIKSLTSK